MRRAFFAALAAAAVSTLPCVARAADAQVSSDAPPALRLPEGARPLRYELTLTVVPGEAKVSGEIAIDLQLVRPHPVLWLNGDEIAVSRATVDSGSSAVNILAGHDQFVGFAFEPALGAGRHRLTLAFEAGQTRNSTRGIFALRQGTDWYAMTQFEALSARRAFPCFDEPGFKVPWQLTLRVPRALTAIRSE